MKRFLSMLVTAGSLAAQMLSYVASVKPNNAADARGLSEYSPGGRFTATAITVASLIRAAYRIQGYQLVGAPGWLATKRYDISAKADESPAPTQQTLLRALLKDQFKLAVHEETREMPVFALVLARNDGRAGPKLTKSDFDCDAYRATPHPAPEPGLVPVCGARSNSGSFSGKAVPVSQLAASLGFFAGRFVVDKTGLAGGYDMDLTWTPDEAAGARLDGPSLFTALQEQLGLKLVPERGPINVLVVDWAAEPAAE
jgi:bla regulator protein blaR1